MRISDWSSDVCSSDLHVGDRGALHLGRDDVLGGEIHGGAEEGVHRAVGVRCDEDHGAAGRRPRAGVRHVERSEEHTSELQSLMRISYAVFCLKKKKKT